MNVSQETNYISFVIDNWYLFGHSKMTPPVCGHFFQTEDIKLCNYL